jgi:hypothetical protein
MILYDTLRYSTILYDVYVENGGKWQVVKAKETKKCLHRDVDDDDLVSFANCDEWGHFYVMGCQLIRWRRQLGPFGPLHKLSSFVL